MNKSNLTRTCTALLFFSIILPAFSADAGLLADIKNIAIGARDRATEARDAARESRNAMREGRMALVGSVRDAISEVAGELADEVNERREFRQAFLDPNNCGGGSPCSQFRLNIIMLVEDLGTLSNSLFIATGLDTRIETTRLTSILNKVPGRALYPMYRAFSEELNIFESNFVNTLSFAADNIGALEDAVVSEGCDLILDNNNFPIPIEDAIRGTKITGSGLELVGGLFEAISTKSIIKEGAIWGWVGVSFKNNRLKNIGIKFKTSGDVLGKYANIASTKLMRCTIKNDNQQIMAALVAFDPDVTNLDVPVSSRSSQDSVDGIQTSVDSLRMDVSTRASQVSVNGLGISLAGLVSSIANLSSQESVNALAETLGNLDVTNLDAAVNALAETLGNLDVTNLDAAVSTRASQASVDALTATLGNLDTGNLDAAVSTRASQVSVDNLKSDLGVHNSMALRIQIEHQLGNSNNAISAYYLPEAYGGLLELVREIVSDTLMQNEAAGIPLKNAAQFFQNGEGAFNNGGYRDAFDNYQKAYQKIVN